MYALSIAYLLLSCLPPSAAEKTQSRELTAKAPPPKLCVTLGAVVERERGRLEVSSAAMRAVVPRAPGSDATLRFAYLGPSEETAPLASGERRRQIGLKLRAQDTCNVVYVMWRIEPESRLVVSVKSNPGKSLHDQCGDQGYRNVTPEQWRRVPVLHTGDWHTLHAELAGERLKVAVDGESVWAGAVGPEALSFDGPIGIRSDNGRFQFELAAGPPDARPVSAGGACPATAPEEARARPPAP